MKIFDAHFHLDKGIAGYGIKPASKNVIFNDVEQYKKHRPALHDTDCVTLIFDYKNHYDFLCREIKEEKLNAIKIHSRIQQIDDPGFDPLFEKLRDAVPAGMPIILDAFYYGADYEFQPNLKRFIQLARLFPKNPIIIAHSGGIKILEYFLHLKNIPNVYFELSFSLAYLKESSVFQDFKVLLKFGDPQKIIFGTDYPYVDAQLQLNTLSGIFDELKTPEKNIALILFENAFTLFSKQA